MFVRVLIVAVVALLLWSAAAGRSESAGPQRTYVVQPHDTLWSIAAANYAGDPREGVWKLRERNRIVNGLILPGQRLVLPP
jgi:LysM repeat protein